VARTETAVWAVKAPQRWHLPSELRAEAGLRDDDDVSSASTEGSTGGQIGHVGGAQSRRR
jgi:hypothetical protein